MTSVWSLGEDEVWTIWMINNLVILQYYWL
jgi:hypothetical protein